MHTMPTGDRRRCQSPWNWSFRWLRGIHSGADTLLCHSFESSLTFNVARLALSFSLRSSLIVSYRYEYYEYVFPALKYFKIKIVLYHFFLAFLPPSNPPYSPLKSMATFLLITIITQKHMYCEYKYINITNCTIFVLCVHTVLGLKTRYVFYFPPNARNFKIFS